MPSLGRKPSFSKREYQSNEHPPVQTWSVTCRCIAPVTGKYFPVRTIDDIDTKETRSNTIFGEIEGFDQSSLEPGNVVIRGRQNEHVINMNEDVDPVDSIKEGINKWSASSFRKPRAIKASWTTLPHSRGACLRPYSVLSNRPHISGGSFSRIPSGSSM